jgi:hypothetical protein
MPATWLFSGCFLGGDYFTERETSVTPSPSAETEDSDKDNSQPPPETPSFAAKPADSASVASSSDPIRDSSLNVSYLDDPSTSPETAPSGPNTTSDDAPTSTSSIGDTSSVGETLSSSDTSNSTSGETCSNEAECAVDNCGDGEMSGPEGRCYWLNVETMTWNAAKNQCNQRGAGWGLIMPRTEGEDAFIASVITVDTWLGAQNTAGFWRWSDDTIFDAQAPLLKPRDTYTNWGSKEPSYSPAETCARYHPYNGVWQWADAKCNESYAVACQGPLPK